MENIFQSTKNTFRSKKNLGWFPGKCFPFILGGKHFPKVVKNLEMSYYLQIISNLILKLLIAIYIYCFKYLLFIFIPYNLLFILTLILIFILLFPYHFLIEIFYLSNLVIILLIVTYFI